MEIFKNDYFTIFSEEKKIFISVHNTGFNINDFSLLIKKFPRVSITNFFNLKNALEKGSLTPVEIGNLKPNVEISITSDNMKAIIKLNMLQEEIDKNLKNIQNEILEILEENNIIYGIKHEILISTLPSQKDIVIAEGILPLNGQDCIIKYIQIPPRKPTIREDGSADYYEMNLIYEVQQGDYLGEKIHPTPGTPGKTICGQILPPKPGNDKLLSYDRKTVEEYEHNGKTLLRALITGAVNFDNGKVNVLNHLTVHGDVGYETGNIDFDGYITIKGTVLDDFSVIADKDISIESPLGIGAVNTISSKNGDIYIKGGVSGKGKAIIEASKNVFIKYANACTISSGESINIGFYSLDSNLSSKNIIVNNSKGKIIGGKLNAKAKVIATTIGNKFEKKTIINVEGFDRKQIKKELDELLITYKKYLLDLEKNKREMKIFENKIHESDSLIDEYRYYQNTHEKLMTKIAKLEEKRKSLLDYLESKGEGEVSILKSAYPQTFLEIKKLQKIINTLTTGTFYTQDNELHSE